MPTTKLEDFAEAVPPIALATIGGSRPLALQIQSRLSAAGLLEPPSDGEFGPISHWALGEFLALLGTADKATLDRDAARALLAPAVSSLLPIKTSQTLAGRIALAMIRKGWWITRHPACVNIIYVEGLNPDGTPNGNVPNKFNDLRVVLRIDEAGEPQVVNSWEATSEPGTFYVKVKKEDPRGAARIAFGQYKSWCVGMHPRSRPEVAHEALVQVKDITVHRDLNEDFERSGDAVFTGLFGINQHWGYDLPKEDIGNASAGCLVGRTRAGHRQFMSLVKADPRYGANRGFRFMTAVMEAKDLA